MDKISLKKYCCEPHSVFTFLLLICTSGVQNIARCLLLYKRVWFIDAKEAVVWPIHTELNSVLPFIIWCVQAAMT